jgi:hypothetical protein
MGTEEFAGYCGREAVYSKVHTVCIDCQGNINTIIEEEASLIASGKIP